MRIVIIEISAAINKRIGIVNDSFVKISLTLKNIKIPTKTKLRILNNLCGQYFFVDAKVGS